MSVRRSSSKFNRSSSRRSSSSRKSVSIDFKKMFRKEIDAVKDKADELEIYWNRFGKRISKAEASKLPADQVSPVVVKDKNGKDKGLSPWLVGMMVSLGVVAVGLASYLVANDQDLEEVIEEFPLILAEDVGYTPPDSSITDDVSIADKLEYDISLDRDEAEVVQDVIDDVAEQTSSFTLDEQLSIISQFFTDAERTRYLIVNNITLTTLEQIKSAGFSNDYIEQWLDR